MITVTIENRKEFIRSKTKLEKALNAKISLRDKTLEIETDPLNEFEAQRVFDAMNLGFSADSALTVLEEEISFVQLNMKDYANTKNLEVVRARVIGTHGKTKLTIEEITKCKIRVRDNIIGIIGPGEIIETAITAITNIIKGTKQANAYRYLERINTQKREQKKGIKEKLKIKL